jgi:hypothetical protein
MGRGVIFKVPLCVGEEFGERFVRNLTAPQDLSELSSKKDTSIEMLK